MTWSVYLVECADGSLYTGISTDVPRRVRQHNNGRGAKYTRARLPVELVWRESSDTRSSALKREYQIKQLPRGEKLKLIEDGCDDS